MLMSGLRLSDLNKETTYLLIYLKCEMLTLRHVTLRYLRVENRHKRVKKLFPAKRAINNTAAVCMTALSARSRRCGAVEVADVF